MASVGQRDTGPEVRLRRTLHRLGLRYRLHDRKLPGSPDLVLPRFKAVIFVHGCFWHVHQGCKFATEPSSRKDFWREKFEANRRRDGKNYDALLASGWRVSIVWECAIKTRKDSELIELGAQVQNWLISKKPFLEIGDPAIPSTRQHKASDRHVEADRNREEDRDDR
jgi:DNA mismatch endonuclease (patch repair protein)